MKKQEPSLHVALNSSFDKSFPDSPADVPIEHLLLYPDLVEAAYHSVYPGEIEFYDQMIRRCVKPDAPIIELGCGFGRVTIPLALKGHRMIGLDRKPEMVDGLRRRSSEAGVNIPVIMGDMRQFAIPGGPAAAMICPLGVLNLLWSEGSLTTHLQSVAANLKSGGLAVYVIPASENPRSLCPQHAVWETEYRGIRTRTDYTYDLLPGTEEIAEYRHLLTVLQEGQYKLLEWKGKKRILTPQFLSRILNQFEELELEGWYPHFNAAERRGGPMDAVSVCVLKRR